MKTINSPRPVGVSGYQKRGANTSLSALAVLAWGGLAGLQRETSNFCKFLLGACHDCKN